MNNLQWKFILQLELRNGKIVWKEKPQEFMRQKWDHNAPIQGE